MTWRRRWITRTPRVRGAGGMLGSCALVRMQHGSRAGGEAGATCGLASDCSPPASTPAAVTRCPPPTTVKRETAKLVRDVLEQTPKGVIAKLRDK